MYVGIDLGTTNSAICSYDGEEVALYKSPEQTDVTPSAIFMDRRGNRYIGMRAYNASARDPGNAATLFKRLMGTSTPISLPALNVVMTPEECSAEILMTLFGYLPEAIRNDPDIGTVITVPAAFNQMQKDATLQAAESAGLGKVALMQEPVAAVMSVMRKRRSDGIFLIYDIGGGTLDIAIAQSVGGRVSLLGQGGIAMCGGRDFDRVLVDNILTPWLSEHFDLPNDFASLPEFKRLRRMAEFAAEKAKIELSTRDEAIAAASESELSTKDRSGAEVYIDCAITRPMFDDLISDRVNESIVAAREAIQKAGLSPHDIERIVFVGGPSQYKPLRDRVAFELGVSPSTDVNPMTAVAEGAAVFAESIDWQTQNRARKSSRGAISADGGLNIVLNYIARTPDARGKLVVKIGRAALPGSSFQVDSLDSGWSSGKVDLKDGASVDLPLSKASANTFKVFVFDPSGGPIPLKEDRIVIARTAATVDAIPASHSIAIEARDKLGAATVLDYLIKEGDNLPKRGQKRYRALESIRAGSSDALNFKIYEGDIDYPVSNNRFVGLFKISGNDFTSGVIPAGAEIICDYELLDSGNIILDVTIPSVGVNKRSGHNFYSRKEAETDYTKAAKRVRDDAEGVRAQIADISRQISDPTLTEAEDKLTRASALSPTETSPETTKNAMDDVQKAKELLARARKANFRVFRRAELDSVRADFERMRGLAKPAEQESFDLLVQTAERDMSNPGPDFEAHLGHMRSKIFSILARQDWFVVDNFNWHVENPHLFVDAELHARLVAEGKAALERNDISALREVLGQMQSNRISSPKTDEFLANANLVKG
ncbi:MAG: Hsp70 family protein [Roseiarcus sp.]